jgi:hypothetical protein
MSADITSLLAFNFNGVEAVNDEKFIVVNVGDVELVPSIIVPPEDTINLSFVKAELLFVPPFAIGKTPVISDVNDNCVEVICFDAFNFNGKDAVKADKVVVPAIVILPLPLSKILFIVLTDPDVVPP